MNSKDDGIFVPRRLVFIMIFVSLCVNVFFLLMGILIGKDDLKWSGQKGEEPLAQTQVNDDAEPGNKLDDDLSVFDNQESSSRRPPTPRNALESAPDKADGKPPRAVVSEPQPQTVTRPEPKAQVTRESVKNTPPPKTESGVIFWIQVMAISDKGKANGFVKKAKSKGFNAVLVNEGAFYKVRIGPYRDRDRAEQDREKANTSLGVKGWLVKK